MTKSLGSTGEAKEALGLGDAQPNYNYAANMYWDACKQIEELEAENERLLQLIASAHLKALEGQL